MVENPFIRIPRFFAWYISGFLFVALIAPLLYFLFYSVIIFIFPFVVLLLLPWMGTKEYRAQPYSTRIEDVKDIIINSIAMLAIIAMLRAATLIFYQTVPKALMMIDTPLIIGVDLLGFKSLAVYDFYLGALGIIVFVIITCEDTFWRIAQHRNIHTMPFSKARSIAIGMVKIKGVAKSLKKIKHKKSLLEHYRSTDPNEKDHEFRIPFLLEDETGKIMIDTEGANFATDTGAYGEQAGFAQYSRLMPHDYVGTILLPMNQKKRGIGSTMYRLRPGDPIYVLGVAQRREPDEESDADIIVRPKTGVFGHRHHDVFFLTNGMDMDPEKYFYHGLWHAWILSLVSIACIGWMIMHAQLGIHDYKAAYGYKPETVLNKFYNNFNTQESSAEVKKNKISVVPITERPIEERCLTLVLGRMCAPEMLDRIHTQSSPGDVSTILKSLETLNLIDKAVAELKKIIAENPDPYRVDYAMRYLKLYKKFNTFQYKHEYFIETFKTKTAPFSDDVIKDKCVIEDEKALCVSNMLRWIYTRPIDEVENNLIKLEEMGAKKLAINELMKLIDKTKDLERVKFAQEKLQHVLLTGSFKQVN